MSTAKTTARTIAQLEPAALADGIERLGRSIRELRGFDVKSVKERSDNRLDVLQRKANAALADLLGIGSADYRRHAVPRFETVLDTTFGDHYSMEEFREALREALDKAVAGLVAAREAMEQRLDTGDPATAEPPLPEEPPPQPAAAARPDPVPPPVEAPPPAPPAMTRNPPSATATAPDADTGQQVLVLGAGADAAVELLAQLGLSPAVLDTPSVGRLEALRDVEFAVVSPEGEDAGTMLAIGFMLAVLGRQRICLLAAATQEMPAALEGALRIAPDEGGLWKLLLAREMKRAGLDIDLNRAL